MVLLAFFDCPRGNRVTPETLVPEGTRSRTLLLDTSPRNRASQEPDGHRREWFPGMERTLSQRRSSCLLFQIIGVETYSFFQTINVQLEALRNYAAQNGMEIVEEFTDEGYSGARLDRPALDRMRDLAERRGFEALLTYCTDRLARKFVLQALILEEMERFGVKTIFLEGGAADDPLSKLMHQITGAVAEFERAKIVERYRRGKLYRARCGEIVSPDVPCGLLRIPLRDGVAAHAEIQETEAATVRRIFEAYVNEGLTVRQIAKRLTLDRTPTPGNAGQWSWGAVDRILHEEAYIGTYYYNRKQCVAVEGVYGKKRQRFKCTLRPKEEWIAISVPPIIGLATFQAAARSGKGSCLKRRL